MALWKSTFDASVRERHELERDYAAARQEWGRQQLSIIETTEANDTKKSTRENELKTLSNNYIEYKRQMA